MPMFVLMLTCTMNSIEQSMESHFAPNVWRNDRKHRSIDIQRVRADDSFAAKNTVGGREWILQIQKELARLGG